MSKILLISGSPSLPSRSGAVLDYAESWLRRNSSWSVTQVHVREFPAEDLVLAKYNSDAFAGFKQAVAEADAILVATPVYKAAYSGALKALLDVLPQHAFRGKTLLPIATGGSRAHLLSIDYALKPVLGVLGASRILQGIYVIDEDVVFKAGEAWIGEEVRQRIEQALSEVVGSENLVEVLA